MELVIVAVLALALGLLIGWLAAARRAGSMASDLAVATMRAADADVARQARDAVERERNEAHQELASLRAEARERQAEMEQLRGQLAELERAAHDLAALRAQSAEREAAHAEALRKLDQSFDGAAAKALGIRRRAAHRMPMIHVRALLTRTMQSARTPVKRRRGAGAPRLLLVPVVGGDHLEVHVEEGGDDAQDVGEVVVRVDRQLHGGAPGRGAGAPMIAHATSGRATR